MTADQRTLAPRTRATRGKPTPETRALPTLETPARDAGTDAGPADGGLDAGAHDAGPPDAGCNPVTLFFGPSCATGLCHSADIQQANLDLASPGMPGRLVGKASNGYPGLLLIDPANPDNSLMYTKTTVNPPGNVFQMPLALDPLTDVQAACLLEWVRNAAAQ